ncbi:MAG: hypothetical protein OEV72_14650, partial [Thermoleophilia bacterium]|nr:hypothetical protein [Thermoleophilia bacterium]
MNRSTRYRWRALGLVMAAGLVIGAVAAAAAVADGTRQIPSAGTTTIRAGSTGVDGLQQPEIRQGSQS